MNKKDLKVKLLHIKEEVISLFSSKEIIFRSYEETTLGNIIALIDDYFLGKIYHKRCTSEDIIKVRLMECGIILSTSNNERIKKLAKVLGAGSC